MAAMQSSGKSLGQMIRVLPKALEADPEGIRGMGKAVMTQWGGVGPALDIAGRAIVRGGTIQSLNDLRQMKMGRFMANFFIAMWDKFAPREAFVRYDRGSREVITYAQMRDRVLALSAGFQQMGLLAKDRVGIYVHNEPEFLETLYAASLLGGIMPAINWHAKASELIQLIQLRTPRILVLDPEFVERVEEIKTEIPFVEHFIVTGKEAPPGYLSYEQVIQNHRGQAPTRLNFLLGLNPYTGGTTGAPKSSNIYDALGFLMSDLAEAPRVPLEEYMPFISGTIGVLYWYGAHEIKDSQSQNIRILVPTPMYHAGTAAGYMPALFMGSTIVPMRKFNPEEFLRLIEAERISWVFVAPTILQRVLALPEETKRKYNLSSMHSVICAAAPATPELKRETNELFMRQGAKLPVFNEYYGTSEGGLITILTPKDYVDHPERLASVGKARGSEVRIRDAESGTWAPAGKPGRVMSRTATTFSIRYPGNEEKVKDAIKTVDGQEWYDDGLIGYLDTDGFLYLTSRIKEMIISGGVNIYPNEIEAVLLRHPKVFDAAVVRAPDPDLGEIAVACIQLMEDETLSENELMEFAKSEGLYGLKLPKKVIFYPELPRHIDGKLKKAELEEQLWQGVQRYG